MNIMESECTDVQKKGGHKVIHSQIRKNVIPVYSFMNKKADSRNLINVSISEATGPKCILKKYKHNK
jgi:hypothetical protein